MKSKRYVNQRGAGTLILAVAIGLAGECYSAQAQRNRSGGINDASEQAVAVKRDPFWPVGYMPKNITSMITSTSPSENTATFENSWSEAMKKVVISGVSSSADNDYFTIINGEVKSVGDTVTINHGGTIYIWAVDSIKPPSSVKLRRVSAE